MTYLKSMVTGIVRDRWTLPLRAPALPAQSRSGEGRKEHGEAVRRPSEGAVEAPSEILMHALVVEAVTTFDALLGAGDVLLLQLLEVGHARHDVVTLRGMAGLRLLQPPLRLLLILGQLLERVPRGVHAGVGGEERDEDELVAELAQLLEGKGVAVARPLEGRGVVEREGQVGVRRAHGLRELDGRFARGVRQLRPHGIDAGVGIQPAP